MFKFRFLLTLLVIVPTLTVNAQFYKHGVGVQLNVSAFKASYVDITGSHNNTFNAVAPGLVYKASLGFRMNRIMTFSVSSYPFLGYQTTGEKGLNYQIPLLAELYFGDLDYSGLFFGLGGSYSSALATDYGGGVILGPQISGGGQFPINENVVSLRASYTFGLNDPAPNTFPLRTYSKSKRGLFAVSLKYVFGY